MKIIKNSISILFWIAVWEIAALAADNPLILPAPPLVLSNTVRLAMTPFFWQTVGVSVLRITLGIVIALFLSVLLSVASSASVVFKTLADPLVGIIKSTPVASFILLLLLWIDRNILPVFIITLIVIPTVYSNLIVGISNIDTKLSEAVEVYQFSFIKKMRRLYIPSVYPYFLSACKSSLGLAWKAGVAAEVLAVPVLSIGKMIYTSKIYMETVDLFSWTLVVILLSFAIEYLLCNMLERLDKKKGKVMHSADT